MTKEEVLSLIDLLERVRLPAEREFQLSDADPLWNLVIYLIKRHLTGRLVTPTSLARAADVPYTTALRRITEMRDNGFLDYRPRTRSGRSFSVHPSEKLIERTFDYALTVKAALAKTLGQNDDVGSFYLGASYLPARMIPAPEPLALGLGGDETLDILMHSDPSYSVGAELEQELSRLLFGKVRFHRTRFDDIRDETLRNAERPASRYDIVAVDLTWTGEYAKHGILLTLDDVIGQSRINKSDFLPGEWEGAHVDGSQYGIPFLTNPEILFYRNDLFEAAGIKGPATTDELLAAARELHSPRANRYGICWAAGRGTTVGQSFIQFLADFGQPILDLPRVADGYDTTQLRRNAPARIDTVAGRATAEYMLRLMEFAPPEILDMTWDLQMSMFNDGRLAMIYDWTSRVSQLQPAAAAHVGFAPHPVGRLRQEKSTRNNVSPVGGFVLGIPSNINPTRRATAWRAIEWFTSPEVIKLFVQHKGGYVMPRFSVAADPEVRRISSVIPAVDAMAKKGQLRLWPRPPVPAFPGIVTILGEEIHDMLSGRLPARQALARAQRRVDQLLDQADTPPIRSSKPGRDAA